MDQPRQQKCQRLDEFQRIFQVKSILEARQFFDRRQLAFDFAARQLTQPQTFGAEPLGNTQRRQGGHIPKPADAPAVQGLVQFGEGDNSASGSVPRNLASSPYGTMLTPGNPRAAQMAASGFAATAIWTFI